MRAITGIAVWLRIEIPRRGQSLGMLALLIAMATATVLTALAGARRGASAVDRLLAHSAAAGGCGPGDIPCLHGFWHRAGTGRDGGVVSAGRRRRAARHRAS